MFRRGLYLSAGLAVLALTLPGRADDLTIGDPPPPLEVSKWVKGEPVKGFDKDQVYVVEFWATWCGPCKTSIPHLTKLQKEYKDKGVTFIGVSVWEESQDGVEPFVKEMGDEMDYRVAMDQVPEGKPGDEGAMASKWMTAAAEGGIPTAFVVGKDGKINWIGHPMAMEEPLQKIVAGEWDVAVAARERNEVKELEKKRNELIAKVVPALRAEDFDKALEILDEALAHDEKLAASDLATVKLNILLKTKKVDQAAEYGAKLVEGSLKDDAKTLNMLAWSLIDPEGEIEAAKPLTALALKAAERASKITEDNIPAILDTYALALFKSGNTPKALELQKKAIDKLKADGEEVDPGMQERLEQYQKASSKGGDK